MSLVERVEVKPLGVVNFIYVGVEQNYVHATLKRFKNERVCSDRFSDVIFSP